MPDVNTASRAEIEDLITEAYSGHHVNLTGLKPADLAATLKGTNPEVTAALLGASYSLAQTVDRISYRLQACGRLIYLSAGQPGQVRILEQARFAQSFASTSPLFFSSAEAISTPQTFPAADAMANHEASSNDDGPAGAADLLALELTPRDSLILLAGVGSSDYAAAAIQSARHSGALTVTVGHQPEADATSKPRYAPDLLLNLPLLASDSNTSTRNLALQKMVVNLVSTLCQSRLARAGISTDFLVRSVNLRALSESLFSNKQRIVMTATGVGADIAADALAATDGSAKASILMLMTGMSALRAQEILFQEKYRFEDVTEGQDR